LVALWVGAHLVATRALSHAPEQASLLSSAALTKLDARGKTDIILASSDDEANPGGTRDPASLYIPIIRGGLGDSLRQLGWAVFYAEQNNFTVVDLTNQAYQKHFAGFLQIPENPKKKDKRGHFHSIHVKSKPLGYSPSAECFIGTTAFDPKDSTPSFFCRPMEPQEWARVLRENIKPLLVQNALVDNGAAIGELVIHMRGGDAMTTHSGLAAVEAALPPCAFYDKILENGDFDRIRIITQSDDLNPCVSEIGRRHPKLSLHVQRGSVNEDAAAIMNAQNLVLAPSYMSLMLALMNERVQTVFYAPSRELLDKFPFGVVPCRAERGAKVYRFRVPGIEGRLGHTLKQRQDWMLAYSTASVTFESEC